MEENRTGIVSTNYGTYYNIRPLPALEPEQRGRLRGKLRLAKSRSDNPKQRHLIMIGDRVTFRGASGDSEVVIDQVLPRDNAIHRASAHEHQALGANLDRALLVTTLPRPEPNFRFVDRFLASCHAGKVEPLLLFTKPDLLDPDNEPDLKLPLVALYRKLGFRTFVANLTATEPQDELSSLEHTMATGTTLLAGRSGTGKSTLINRLVGRDVQRVASVSNSTKKGRHTTTNSTLIVHNDRKALFIDTPGIKEWGVNHLNRRQIMESFPELTPHAKDCPFANCDHQPGDLECAVQAFIRRNIERYNSLDPDDEAGFQACDFHLERLSSLDAMIESLDRFDRIRTGDYIKPTGRMRADGDGFTVRSL